MTLPPIPGQIAGAKITLAGTATSGLPVTYAVTGPATVTDHLLTATGLGTVLVTASQPGNAFYAASSPVMQSFKVAKAGQTITFPVPGDQPLGMVYLPNATATSGLKITYTVVSGPATLAGGKLSFSSMGAVVLRASQAGNGAFAAAPDVQVRFNVVKRSQTITFPVIGTAEVGQTLTLTATTTSGLPAFYNIASGPATLSGNRITFTGVGRVMISASQPGDATFAAARTVSLNVTVR